MPPLRQSHRFARDENRQIHHRTQQLDHQVEQQAAVGTFVDRLVRGSQGEESTASVSLPSTAGEQVGFLRLSAIGPKSRPALSHSPASQNDESR